MVNLKEIENNCLQYEGKKMSVLGVQKVNEDLRFKMLSENKLLQDVVDEIKILRVGEDGKCEFNRLGLIYLDQTIERRKKTIVENDLRALCFSDFCLNFWYLS
jgi:hypothetical protein